MYLIQLFRNLIRLKTIRFIALILYTALIFYLSLMSASSFPENNFLTTVHFDKWVHIMMFFGLWTLLVWSNKGFGELIRHRNKTFIGSTIIAFIMGVSIEFLQSKIGRTMEFADIVADMLGVLLAYLFWIKFENKWQVYKW